MPKKNEQLFSIIASRHFRLGVGVAVAAIVYLINRNTAPAISLLIMSWVGFAITYLAFLWAVIALYHPVDVRKQATREDTTGSFIFMFVVVAAVCSLAGTFLLLKTIPAKHISMVNLQMILSFVCVFCSWTLVHTLFTLRYAHLYYQGCNEDDDKAVGSGLNFPGGHEPDYLDFAYFSFVLGMTFQVSDVEVTARKIRRLVLLHGCLSFFYNTIILALSINVISGIISNK